MSRFSTALFLLILPLAVEATPDDAVVGHKAGLELASCLAEQGFKVRDGHYTGMLAKKEPLLIEVNLYSGADYRFVCAATDKATLSISVFDEKGDPVQILRPMVGSTAAIDFAPKNSGPYYLRILDLQGDPTTFCLTYCYK